MFFSFDLFYVKKNVFGHFCENLKILEKSEDESCWVL